MFNNIETDNVSAFLLTIPLIVAAGALFVVTLKLAFRKSIVFKITAITTIPIVVVCIIGYGFGLFGIKHLIWVFPVFAPLFIGVFYWIAVAVRKPLNKITNNLKTLSQGDVSIDIDQKDMKGGNEFAEEFRSMDALIKGLKNMAEYASNIGQGELDSNYNLLGDKDLLGKALIEMQHNLKAAKTDQDKYKQQEEDRNWVTQGLANFGDILRKDNDDLEMLTYNIISNLVKYLDANQGGIFIINNADTNHVFLEMTACYAFDRRKFLKKEIEFGEGLVGTCVQEKETVFITDVPNDYVTITSGLGGDNPRSILIVPLKLNNDIYGVIEIASFKPIMPFQISFIEQLAENVAATVSAVKVAERTNKLLEQTQLQAQEMIEQEEELRQNMEELQATQEESARRDSEMRLFLDAVYQGGYIIEFDPDRKVVAINDLFVDLIGTARNNIIGLSFNGIIKEEYDLAGQSYEDIWTDLLAGKTRNSLDRISFSDGSHRIFREHYAPIPDRFGKVYKVMAFATIAQEEAKVTA